MFNCIAQGILLNIMRQPGWEGSLGEKGYMYIHGWVPLLSTWNYHNIANWLYSNMKEVFFFLKNKLKLNEGPTDKEKIYSKLHIIFQN